MGLHVLHLNINSLQNKVDKIPCTAKQPNASIVGINECKLD